MTRVTFFAVATLGLSLLGGAATTAQGQFIFAGNDGDGTVGQYSASTGAKTNAPSISLGLSNQSAHFQQFVFVAVSGSDLYVTGVNLATGPSAGKIGKYNAITGAPINASLVSGLEAPFGIAVSGSTLFVTDIGSSGSNGTVGEYDANTGATINAALVSGLHSPIGVAVSGSDLFVVNNKGPLGGKHTGSIGKYNAITGATINAALVPNLSYADCIAVSGSSLFVTPPPTSATRRSLCTTPPPEPR